MTASCPYVVGGYTFAGFASPLPKSTIKAGSTLPLKFQLLNASGQPIGDTEAQSLIAPSCKFDHPEQAGRAGLRLPEVRPHLEAVPAQSEDDGRDEGRERRALTVMLGGAIVATGDLTPFTVR